MGMFDTILVKRELIDLLIEKDIKESLQLSVDEKYYLFQTKCLEKFLWIYYIEEDHKLYKEESDFFDVEKPSADKTFEPITTYIKFYDRGAVCLPS